MTDDPKLQMTLAIVKRFYPEMPADYRGRRVQIAIAAIEECMAMLPDEIDLFRIIRAAGRSNVQKARAVADHLKGPTE